MSEKTTEEDTTQPFHYFDMSEKTTEGENTKPTYYDAPALIAKERQLTTTLRSLEAMLKKIQDLRTKVNFERTQLITLIEMARRGERMAPNPEPQVKATPDESSDKDPADPLLILDRLYNGEFCMSEEEDEDDEDENGGFRGCDNFGMENVEW